MCRSSTPAPLEFNWLHRLRSAAQIFKAVEEEDPRHARILRALADCDNAYRAGDRELFMKEAANVARLGAFVPGAVIRWVGADKKQRGPAVLNEVIYDDGRLWACVKWAGHLYWINEIIITGITSTKAS